MTFDFHRHWQKVDELLGTRTPFATATLVDVRGSAPQILGAKAIITSDGIVEGTVGGGKIEAKVISQAQGMLDGDNGLRCSLETWNLQTDIGMTCGGEVKFFFEVQLCNDWQIAVFGAGHVAQSLIPLLLQMNSRVTCIDQREAWLSRLSDHPRLTKRCVQELKDEVCRLSPASFFVLMTQGHATDLPVLAEVLKTLAPPFVGALGSLQKAKILRRDLAELGIPQERLDKFVCPIGLPIGNNTPPEISVSIAAQLIQVRDQIGVLQHKTKVF